MISHRYSSYLLFFFLMIRRPPRSTPFPTRRSSDLAAAVDEVDAAEMHDDAGVVGNQLVEPAMQRGRRLDRKSTRLNSSHDQISYAVFCLKKKKKKNQRNYTQNK